jgi:hypothetical protein
MVMSKTCINHKDAPAATMCHQCHVPLCKACSIVTPQGTFCSPECSVLHRTVTSTPAEAGPKGMPKLEGLIKVVAAVVLIWVGFYGIHVAALRVPKLRKIDVVGRILGVFDARQKGNLD